MRFMVKGTRDTVKNRKHTTSQELRRQARLKSDLTRLLNKANMTSQAINLILNLVFYSILITTIFFGVIFFVKVLKADAEKQSDMFFRFFE